MFRWIFKIGCGRISIRPFQFSAGSQTLDSYVYSEIHSYCSFRTCNWKYSNKPTSHEESLPNLPESRTTNRYLGDARRHHNGFKYVWRTSLHLFIYLEQHPTHPENYYLYGTSETNLNETITFLPRRKSTIGSQFLDFCGLSAQNSNNN